MEFLNDAKAMDELLEQARMKIKACPKPILHSTTINGFSNKEGWSDEKLEEIAKNIRFSKEIFYTSNYKKIINQFFHLYFTGDVKDPSVLQSTIFAAAALLNVRDEKGNYRRVFDEQFIYEEGESGKFFFSWKENPECDALHRVDIGRCRFKREVETTLRSWDEDKIWEYENQVNLVRLTAFLALTFCRVVAKNETQMMGALRSRTYRLSLAECAEWELDLPFSSPCEECLQKCKDHLGNGILNPFFAIVVRRWVMAERANTLEEEEVKFVLHESLLDTTECHGLGIIKLLLSVMRITGRTFEEILAVILVVATDVLDYTDWQFLVHFYKEYLEDKKPPSSLPWARLVDNDYFRNCSSKESPYVAATLTSIMEKSEGPDIWKAEWIKRVRASPYFLLIGQKLGQIVREIFLPTDPEEKKIQDAKKTETVKKNSEQGNHNSETEGQDVEENQDLEKKKRRKSKKRNKFKNYDQNGDEEGQDDEEENQGERENQNLEKQEEDTSEEKQGKDLVNESQTTRKKRTRKRKRKSKHQKKNSGKESQDIERRDQDLEKQEENTGKENKKEDLANEKHHIIGRITIFYMGEEIQKQDTEQDLVRIGRIQNAEQQIQVKRENIQDSEQKNNQGKNLVDKFQNIEEGEIKEIATKIQKQGIEQDSNENTQDLVKKNQDLDERCQEEEENQNFEQQNIVCKILMPAGAQEEETNQNTENGIQVLEEKIQNCELKNNHGKNLVDESQNLEDRGITEIATAIQEQDMKQHLLEGEKIQNLREKNKNVDEGCREREEKNQGLKQQNIACGIRMTTDGEEGDENQNTEDRIQILRKKSQLVEDESQDSKNQDLDIRGKCPTIREENEEVHELPNNEEVEKWMQDFLNLMNKSEDMEKKNDEERTKKQVLVPRVEDARKSEPEVPETLEDVYLVKEGPTQVLKNENEQVKSQDSGFLDFETQKNEVLVNQNEHLQMGNESVRIQNEDNEKKIQDLDGSKYLETKWEYLGTEDQKLHDNFEDMKAESQFFVKENHILVREEKHERIESQDFELLDSETKIHALEEKTLNLVKESRSIKEESQHSIQKKEVLVNRNKLMQIQNNSIGVQKQDIEEKFLDLEKNKNSVRKMKDFETEIQDAVERNQGFEEIIRDLLKKNHALLKENEYLNVQIRGIEIRKPSEKKNLNQDGE